MALTTTEEAQTRALISQNAALLSLAASEPTIISKLAATKVSLADLTAATSLNDTDLLLIRQGTTEKSVARSVLTASASETVRGIVELATLAEIVAGVDSVRAVTPAGLMSGFTSSLSINGWQKLPNGLIIQWGNATTVASNGAAGTSNVLPLTFPNSFYQIFGTDAGATDLVISANGVGLSSFNAWARDPSSTGAFANSIFHFFAIGR